MEVNTPASIDLHNGEERVLLGIGEGGGWGVG